MVDHTPFNSFMLKEPVVGTCLGRIPPCALLLPIFGLARRLEEQTRALTLLD